MSGEVALRLRDVDGAEHRVPVAGAVFDCDGLLVDSESVWLRMLSRWTDAAGEPIDAAVFHGLSVTETAARLAAASGSASQADVEATLTADYSALLADGVAAMPGAEAFVGALAGRVPLAVASNGLRRDVRTMLADAGLAASMDAVLTLDDVAAGKPAPDLYALACRTLGIEPHLAVAFEDSPAGATAAMAAGLIVVGVNADDAVPLPCHVRLASLADAAADAPAPATRAQTPDTETTTTRSTT